MTDLNTLIPASSDSFLFQPTETNSRGQIVGFGLQKSTGEFHAFLATPSNSGVASESATPAARARAAKSRRSLSLKMFASCFSSDCASADRSWADEAAMTVRENR